MEKIVIKMNTACDLYTRGNNAGMGYAPYTNVAGDDTIENAVDAATSDGWIVILERETSQEVVVLRNDDEEMMAIGGDDLGHGAWAVMISDMISDEEF